MPTVLLTQNSQTTAAQVAICLLLILLLIEKEVVRVLAPAAMARWMLILNMAIVPLLGVFAFVILSRLTAVLR